MLLQKTSEIISKLIQEPNISAQPIIARMHR